VSVSFQSDKDDVIPLWIPSLSLHPSDMSILNSQYDWLNDRIVDAVNRIISHRLAVAWKSTLQSQCQEGFDPLCENGIMIIHANNHWVTAAAIQNQAWYVDSMRPHRPLTAYIIRPLLLQLR